MKPLILSVIAMSVCSIALAADLPTFSAKRLSAEVKALSSDTFEGRGPATPAETKTIDYMVTQMKAAGLQPGGDLMDGKRTWTQAVPLRRSQIVGTPVLTLHLDGGVEALTQGEQIAVRAPMDGSTSVAIANAPLVFVGYGVKAPERQWDDFKGVDLHGKIAVVLINDPDFETGMGDFGGKAMTYYGRWTYKYEEAARQGAAAAIIVHETYPAAYGWQVVRNSNSGAKSWLAAKDKDMSMVPIQGWITLDTAQSLFKNAGLNYETEKAAANKPGFKAVPMTGETLTVDAHSTIKHLMTRNVAGIIKGSTNPDDVLIYSAHWD
ncbi:MAG: PA domain-containing protein, partial [Rhodanobacter sp.]